jgi:hypothetical protein
MENDLAGYKVYYGTQSEEYDFVIDVGDVTHYTVTGLEPETLYYLALTAYDTSWNESDFSAEVSAVTGDEPDPAPSPNATSLIDSDSSGGGCFIATAAYGSYLDPHVKILRDFRDEFLSSTSLGRKCVYLYYQYGPRIADRMGKYGFLRFLTRQALLPLIGLSSLSVKTATSPPFLFLPLCLFLIFTLVLRPYFRQAR